MTGRTLRIALIVSIVLNIFIIGGIVGAALAWRGAADRSLSVAARGSRLRSAGDALPVPVRRRYLLELHAAAQDSHDLVLAGRATRVRAAAALSAPAYDPAALAQALDRIRAADFAVRARAERAIVDAARDMTLGERLILADGLRHNGPFRLPRPTSKGKPVAVSGMSDGNATAQR